MTDEAEVSRKRGFPAVRHPAIGSLSSETRFRPLIEKLLFGNTVASPQPRNPLLDMTCVLANPFKRDARILTSLG